MSGFSIDVMSGEEKELAERISREYREASSGKQGPGLKHIEEEFLPEFVRDSSSARDLRKRHGAENYRKAYKFLRSYNGDVSVDFILKVHSILMHNIRPDDAGRTRKVEMTVTGAAILPSRQREVKGALKELVSLYKKNGSRYHPILLAAWFHIAFEGIHPFVDGNGRTGRLLLNFILMRNGYPPIKVKEAWRDRYIEALDDGKKETLLRPMVSLILDLMGRKENEVVAFCEKA